MARVRAIVNSQPKGLPFAGSSIGLFPGLREDVERGLFGRPAVPQNLEGEREHAPASQVVKGAHGAFVAGGDPRDDCCEPALRLEFRPRWL